MNHYDLTNKEGQESIDLPNDLDTSDMTPPVNNEFSVIDLSDAKQGLLNAKNNVDKAETIVRSLGLTDFEIKVLARRLLGEDYL